MINVVDVRSQHTLPLARIKKVMKSDEQVKVCRNIAYIFIHDTYKDSDNFHENLNYKSINLIFRR